MKGDVYILHPLLVTVSKEYSLECIKEDVEDLMDIIME